MHTTDGPGAPAVHSFEQIIEATRARALVDRAERVGSARIGVSEMRWPTGRNVNLTASYAALTLYRSTTRIRHVISGAERPTRKFLDGDLMLRPPNLEYITEYEQAADMTVLALEPELVQSVTTAFNADVAEVFGRLESRPFRSSLIEGMSRRLASCASLEGDRLYADALTQALIHELWQLADGTIRPSELAAGVLSTRQLRRIDDAIAEASGEPITLGWLAELTEMSMTAFTAAMKEATGMTPYKYVLARRVARARDLIEKSGLPLLEIAFHCGFSSQSHMTDVFRTKLGTTPGKLRAQRV